MKNISNRMIFAGNKIDRCDHYCKNKVKKCNFYDWYSYLDHKFIKRMCEKCALRERWGYRYKSQKGYKR